MAKPTSFAVTLSLACIASLAGPACTITTSDGTIDGGATDAGVDGSSGGPLGFAPSNIAAFLASVDLTKLMDMDVTSANDQLSVHCNSGCVSGMVTQSDGSTLAVYFARSWKIEPAAGLGVTDKTPVAIVALTTVSVLGGIHASGADFTAVGGGFTGMSGVTGGGGGGGLLGSGGANSDGIGGGGASYCGVGGAGGNATATNGAAGKVYGSPALVPLLAGSAGGGGALFGGAGGGAIQIVAGTSITIGSGGVVDVGAGGGSNGNGYGTGQTGSGGGSGGGLLLEAPTVSVSGTLEANGGAGGGSHTRGADATTNGAAAVGGDQGTTGAGGNGSAGTTTAGVAGANGDTSAVANFASGGGGGGAGYIRINSQSGSATLTGTLSPSVGTTCVTQGTLGR